jgi:phosphatidylglycerophosphatase A
MTGANERVATNPTSMLATWLATGFGSGYSPIAPGTAGSVVGLLMFWPVAFLPFPYPLVATVVLFFLGVQAATIVERESGLKDPGIVVVDEIIGIWVSLLFLPWTLAYAAGAFLLFRIFDVVKPFPARTAEKSLPRGWGIVCDDVVAGIYANLVLQGVRWYVG